MKKLLMIGVILSQVLFLLPQSAKALSNSKAGCFSIDDVVKTDIAEHQLAQTFTTTGMELNEVGVAVGAKSISSKMKIVIYNISSIWDYRVMVSKNVSVEASGGWKIYTVQTTNLPAGTYAIALEPINDGHIYWYGTHYDCYSDGSAISDGERISNLDYTFTVNTVTEDLANPTDEQVEPDQPSGNSSTAPTTATPSPGTQSPNTGSTSATNSTSTTNQETAVATADIGANPPGNLSEANQPVVGVSSISDEELEDLLRFIKGDYERNRPQGIFGLSGVVGRILTVRNVAIGGAIILALIVFWIIHKIRRKPTKIPQSETQQK